MSFILDALKKSEENRTGDLSRQPGRHVLSPGRPARRRWALLLICILVPVVSLVLGWWLGSKPQGTVPQPAELVDQQQPVQMAPPVAASRPPVTEAGPPTKIPEPVMDQAQTAPPLSAPVPQKLQEEVPVSQPVIVTETPSVTPRPQSPPEFDSLPPSLRGEIPALDVSLHFYSPDRARRMVRINGQILHEHEFVADNLTIEEIRESSTLFNYRGQLFELPAPGTR